MFVLNALRFSLLSLLLSLAACDEDAGDVYVVGLLPDPVYERVMFIIFNVGSKNMFEKKCQLAIILF